MTGSKTAEIGQDLRRLFDGGCVAGLSDTQLVECLSRRDLKSDAAFEAILTAHGPAVLASCRRRIGNHAAADDAFQATFLVLWRRAGTIKVGESLRPWLLKVARLGALKLRQGELRRRARECRAARPEELPPDEMAHDMALVVRSEVDRLPQKYRDPVCLCYLEGHTHNDAAAALGWPVGTVSGRLARARRVLRSRLARRGVSVSSAALAAALTSQGEVRAEVSGLLRDATLAATTGGGAVAAELAALAAELARSLAAAAAVRAAVVILMVVSLLSAGAGIAALAGRSAEPHVNEASARGKPANGGQAAPCASAVDLFGDPLPKGAIARLGTNRFRHSLLDGANHLSRVFLSRDGASLVTTGSRGGVSVWEAATGHLVRSIDASEAALAPDGKLLATARPGSVRVLDFATGRELSRTAIDPKGQCKQLVFSADGSMLAALTVVPNTDARQPYVAALVVWDSAELTERFRRTGDFHFTRALAFAPDGRTIALATPDRKAQVAAFGATLTQPDRAFICLLSATDGSEVRRVPIDRFDVASVAFSPDGRTVAAGVGDRTIRLFDASTGTEQLPRLNYENAQREPKPGETVSMGYDSGARAMLGLAFSPDGSLLASGLEGIGYWNGRGTEQVPIVVWDVREAPGIRPFPWA